MDIADAELRETIDEIVVCSQRHAPLSNRPIVFVGAGHLAGVLTRRLAGQGLQPIGYCDNNPAIHGTMINGIPVTSLQEAVAGHGRVADFIITFLSSGPKYDVVRTQLQSYGAEHVEHYLPFMIAHKASCLPWFSYDVPATLCGDKARIFQALSLLCDDESRSVFIGSLRFRGLGDLAALHDEDGDDQYFPNNVFKPLVEEAFVDCGAYDGDTLQSFVRRYGGSGIKSYFGFEPDADSFEYLTKRCDGIGISPERIKLWNAATWVRNEVLRFAADATMVSHIDKSGGANVQAITLDTALAGTSPSLIKLDVEGAEAETLLGAKSLIATHSPVIAACVYHKPHDLWDLLLLIRELNPCYSFFLRNHGCGGFELVLYAVPQHRLTGAA